MENDINIYILTPTFEDYCAVLEVMQSKDIVWSARERINPEQPMVLSYWPKYTSRTYLTIISSSRLCYDNTEAHPDGPNSLRITAQQYLQICNLSLEDQINALR